jgi:hypothetical protein
MRTTTNNIPTSANVETINKGATAKIHMKVGSDPHTEAHAATVRLNLRK